MKSIFTQKNLFKSLLVILLFCATISGKAQTLEEIPNPPGYSLNFYSGGENDDLFFDYNDGGYYTELFHYDGMGLSLLDFGMDLNFSFYSHAYGGNNYIVGFDFYFNAILFEYDGTSIEQVTMPAGTEYGNYVGNYDGKMYFSVFDANFDNTLYAYDGTDMVEIPNPTGLNFGNLVSVFDGVMYLAYNDDNFNFEIMAFDGTTLTPLASAPTGLSYSFLTGETSTELYLVFFDNNTFDNSLFTFDGTTLTEVPSPMGMQFNFAINIGEDISFLNYVDATFNNFYYSWDGTTLTELNVPAGFQFPGYVHEFDNKHFFNFFDFAFNQVLMSYDGTDFTEVNAPADFTFSQFTDTLAGNAYYLYFDYYFNFHLMELEAGSNTVSEIPGPSGLTFSNFETSFDEKLFLSYFDAGFERTLYTFDGQDFSEIENPSGIQYGNFMTEDLGFLYLRYNDINSYSGTLYKLRLNSFPTSADNSVTTFINTPYFFESNDFDFADNDGDVFTSILITEVETVGNLFLDGAHVYVGDLIDVQDLPKLVFFPNTGDEALNYDLFKFKVFDGDDFSESDYTMNINVIDIANSTKDNFLDAKVLLYPVPADQFTSLKIDATQVIKELDIKIVSMSGQTVYQNNFKNIGQTWQHTFELSHLPEGQYVLYGNSPKGIISKSLMINR